MILEKCKFCGKEFEPGDEHFELEDERAKLFSAIWELEAVTGNRYNHSEADSYKRFINRLKRRLKVINGRLNDSKAK
jgi:hypothetical protein